MKGPQKITRIHLSVSEQDEPSIFGIVTPDADYKISLKLNKKLKISLKNSTPLEVEDNEGKKLDFSKFSDTSASPDSAFHLVSNRSGKNYFLKNLKNIDYILVLYDQGKKYNSEQITTSLREIETITAVFNIDRKVLKNKNLINLI
jgi:hypothetical protein